MYAESTLKMLFSFRLQLDLLWLVEEFAPSRLHQMASPRENSPPDAPTDHIFDRWTQKYFVLFAVLVQLTETTC